MPDIQRILGLLPDRRQNLMFSATFSDDIRRLSKTILRDPDEVEVAPRNATVDAIRQIVHAIDPEQPISNVRTIAEVVAEQTASRVAQLRVLGVLAAVALLLAGVGIHGLLSFTVSSRSQEIGVRLALGARSSMILRMVLREGLALALLGIVPGVLIGYAGGRAMEALLVGVKPGDAPTVSIAVLLCAVTTVVGCLRPALRASRVDPLIALRHE